MAMWVGREEEIPAYRLAHNQESTPATLGLYKACEEGDAVQVAQFLASGGRANYFDAVKGGTTPVHAAATLPKDAAALKALIAFAATEPGDDLKPLFDLPSTVLKATPLHCAAEAGNCAQLEVPFKLGLDADCENAYGDSPLLVACANNRADAVSLLLTHGADPTKANHKGQNGLHMCISGLGKALRTDVAKENVDAPAAKENAPAAAPALTGIALAQAAAKAKVVKKVPSKIDVQLLVAKRLLADPKVALAKRVDPNAADANGQTPLHHIAGMKEQPATVALAKLLLASGARAKVPDKWGKRPSELGAGRATPRGELTALLKRHELLVLG